MSAAHSVAGAGNAIIAQVQSEDGSIRVTVLDSCTIQHIPGAIVTIGELRYVTDTFGSTTFMVPPSGEITINVGHSGYYSSSLLAASSTYTATYTIFLVPLKPCYP